MIKCEICNNEFKNKRGLSSHIIKSHKETTIEEYYLRYISADPLDGKCHRDGCENKARFIGMSLGFHKHCSCKCSTLSNKIKEKRKCTMLDRYGVEHPIQNKEIKEKIKKTNLEKYNQTSPLKNKDIREKAKNTIIDKYGVDNIFKNEEIKEKIRQTNLNKYGVEYILQSEEIKNKSKQTNLEKYGVENPIQSEEIKKRIRQTNLKKYGCENPFQNKEIKNKIKQTNLNRYGVEYSARNEEIKEKTIKTKYNLLYNKLLHSNRLLNLVNPLFNINEYNGVKYSYKWKCTKCDNIFEDNIDDGKIPRCPICYPTLYSTSIMELEIYEFIKNISSDAINSNRTVLENNYELDIYIPSKNLAIEFNGLYWHSELNGKDKNYHLNKTNECLSKGIQLIHIFEDEWIENKNIVKSILLNKLKTSINKIYARNCQYKEVNNNDASLFLDDNHLQGSINGKHLGLYYNNELISILTYGTPRFNSNYEFEILRFCNKINTVVVGGLSKLIDKINSYSIVTYSDRRYGNGESYKKIRFNLIGKSKPSYYYIKNGIRFNRMNFQKHLLESKLESFDSNLTEWQNMQLSGYDRIWDCGCNIYEYIN